jgi:serine/threonine protein kinase
MTGKMARLQVGSQIDHFTLKELLGQGGFGTVYRAVETETGRECAVKFLRRGPPDQYDRADRQSRFEREANILMALKHPSIPRAFGCNLQRAPIYVAQEFIRGTTLEHEIYERVKAGRHKFTLEEAVQLLSKIARAVHYANEMGVVHRDLKPANVMLVSNKKDRVKVLDFGIAKIMTSDSSKGTTQGRVLGTVSVMSPEQLQGLPDIDQRADVFALGVLTFEILTLRRCWARAGDGSPLLFGASRDAGPNEYAQIMRRICTSGAQPKIIDFRDDLIVRHARRLDEIIGKALRVDRNERTQSALQLAHELETVTSPQLEVPEMPPVARAARANSPPPGPSKASSVHIDQLRDLARVQGVELPSDSYEAVKKYVELEALPVARGRPSKLAVTAPAPDDQKKS